MTIPETIVLAILLILIFDGPALLIAWLLMRWWGRQ